MASARDLRKRITRSLLDEMNEVQYPCTTMLDRVEPTLADPDDLSDYIEVLIDKVEASRFPSISLLNRLDGLLDQLEQLERQQQQRQQAQESQQRELQAA